MADDQDNSIADPLPAMEDSQLPRIDIDGYSLPYRWEGTQLFVLGFWDEANSRVVPTPRPELYIVRIPCKAHFVVQASQSPFVVDDLPSSQSEPAPVSAGEAVGDSSAASDTTTNSQG